MQHQADGGAEPASFALTPHLRIVAVALFLLAWLPSWFGPAGVFIDEAYYLACADHLAFGYVDHPPFSILVLSGWRTLFGDSLPLLRLLPALSGAASVLLAGHLARRLGASSWGQLMAGIAVASAPVLQSLIGFYSMNAFSVLFWTGIFLLLIEIEKKDEPRLWLAVGALAGLGLQNKHTLALLALGLGTSMLVTQARRHFRSPWLWAGLGLGALIIAPNLIWQMLHDWVSLEFYRQADLLKNNPTPAFEVLMGQVNAVNPASLPLWLSGLAFLLFARRGRSLRHLGVLFLVLLGLVVVGEKSRPDRIAGVYPLLFCAGATLLEQQLRRPRFSWLRTAYPALLALVGIVLAPVAFPLLPPEQMAIYTERLGIIPQIEAGEGKVSRLPQWLADRYEWEGLVDQVEAAVARLSSAEREGAVIYGASYGLAAPVEYLGRGRNLLPVYSGHNSYFLWGPPPEPVEVAIIIGLGDARPDGGIQPEEGLRQLFAQIELASVYHCQWCPAWRNGTPIWIARKAQRPIAEAWPELHVFR